MRVKFGDVIVASGGSGFTWLNALKNSERNCSRRFSPPRGKSRAAERSTFQKPAARKIFRPALPNEPGPGIANAALLNHPARLGLARCELPTRSTNPLLPV